VWLIHPDAEAQLHLMSFRDGTSTPVPVYLPPGGLSATPYGTLLGRPVLPLQAMETVGDLGDILLVDLSQYLVVLKTGGLRTDVSMHLYFDYGQQAYRFTMRLTGTPWWSSAIAQRDGSSTQSAFVTLQSR
jgi:HK97 family phage major capsid protein